MTRASPIAVDSEGLDIEAVYPEHGMVLLSDPLEGGLAHLARAEFREDGGGGPIYGEEPLEHPSLVGIDWEYLDEEVTVH